MEIETTPVAVPHLSTRRFWLAWLGWNALGLLVSTLIRVFVLNWVTNTFLPQINAAEFSGWVSLVIILGMAFSIVTAQYFFLRRYLPAPISRAWMLVTALGYFLFYLGSQSGTYGAFMQNNFQDYVTFAQAHAGELTFFSYVAGLGGGLLLGFFQWLVLRLHLNKATSWLGWTALGWVAYELPVIIVGSVINNMVQTGQISQEALTPLVTTLLSMTDFPLSLLMPVITGIGLARLLRQRESAEAEFTEDARRKQLLLRWTMWTAAALLVDRIFYGLGVSSFIANLISPTTAESSGGINWGVTVSLMIEGAILGTAQVVALGKEYRYRWAWAIATVGAYFLEGVGQQWPVLFNALSWGRTGFTTSPGLFTTFIWLVLSDLPMMLGFAVFQTAALWQWAGKRSWMWLLAGPAIYLAAAMMGLLFGLATNIAFTAAASGYMIVILLRTGWVADVVLAPQGETPSLEELSQAAGILQARLADSLGISGQVVAEDGLLIASFTSEADAELAADVLLQKGGAGLFEADSVLVVGQPTPAGKKALFGAEEILEARSRAVGRSEKALLELTLSEEAAQKVEDLLTAHPQALMALAVDGKVVKVFEPGQGNTQKLVIPDFDDIDASFLAGILNNDPLPFDLALAEEE